MPTSIVISSYARTPMGGLQGSLAKASAVQLGSTAVKAAVQRAGVDSNLIERIYMGCVLPAGQGQAPARQAALVAGLPQSVEATTINKMCGSSMQALIMGAEAIAAGSVELMVTGGMESMTNSPYLLTKHRGGARIGHDVVKDSMYLDGLEDAYTPGKLMGAFGEDSAQAYGFTREAQDAYAIESLSRANAAIKSGAFDKEVVPVTIGDSQVTFDEQPGKARLDKIPLLKPAFAKNGTITAANASSISDGAAALVIANADFAGKHGMPVVARLIASASHAHEPALFSTAPVFAIKKVLAKAGWNIGDVDLWEVNEAFAVVAMIAMHDLKIPHAKMNIHGGACALGHPLGASGARIVATLIAALERTGGRRGVASLCIGGGEATAVAIELI